MTKGKGAGAARPPSRNRLGRFKSFAFFKMR